MAEELPLSNPDHVNGNPPGGMYWLGRGGEYKHEIQRKQIDISIARVRKKNFMSSSMILRSLTLTFCVISVKTHTLWYVKNDVMMDPSRRDNHKPELTSIHTGIRSHSFRRGIKYPVCPKTCLSLGVWMIHWQCLWNRKRGFA